MSTPQTYKPSEGKREEFRKYLEKAGIMDALTKVLVNLYEEVDKPEDALNYIIEKLSLQAGLETHKQLTAKLDEANSSIKQLQDEIEVLKAAAAENEDPETKSVHSVAKSEAAESPAGEEQPVQ
ncbi:unnamed protein product [Phyllotreta striolata]|uniref:c-Myc-binding protein n=1 Tax=Phyllotreta striolata TaxID=444603 RepID=A0A9N9TML9_PHYSR|nr:unnamed protein product [Phyllotreta striolata]